MGKLSFLLPVSLAVMLRLAWRAAGLLALSLCASAQTTTWFSAVSPYVVIGGSPANGSIGGRNSLLVSGVNSETQFTATGSAISVSVYPTNASGCAFNVDGTASTPTLTVSTWQVVAIYTGGVDTLHNVTITNASANTCYFDRSTVSGSAGFVEVTGAAPAIGYTTGYGPSILTTALPIASLATDGTMFVSTGLYSSASIDGQVRFRGSCADVWLWTYQITSTSYNLFVNGVQGATTAEGTGWGWIHVGTGLNASAEAEYVVTFPDGVVDGMEEVMCGGGSINTSYLPPRKSYLAYGDSITQATGGSNIQDSTYGYPRLTAQGLGYGLLNFGTNGAHVVGTSGSALDYRTFDVTNQYTVGTSISVIGGTNQTPAIVSILGGINDIGSVTVSVFQASYQDMLYKLVMGMPSSTVFYCWDIMDTGTGTPATIAPFRAAIAQAVAQMQSPHVIHVLTAGWWYPYLQATAIGLQLHPNVSGYATIEQKWLPTVQRAPLVPAAAVAW